MDITGIGSAIRKGFKAAGKAAMVAEGVEEAAAATDLARSWQRRFIASDVQPTAPAQVVKDANPSKARQLHAMTDADDSGELASNLYGTSREEALAHDLALSPQR